LIIPDNIAEIALKDRYFDLKGLSVYSAMGTSALRNYIRNGDLPCFKLPGKNGRTGKILIKKSEFDAWMERFRDNDYIDLDTITDDVMESLSGVEHK